VALAAATAKSVVGVRAGSAFSIYLKRYRISFDGVTASAVPVLIEVCQATFATNAPGTASTSVTPVLTTGRSTAVGATAAKNWTTEPTVLTVVEEVLLTPNAGVLMYDFPLQDEPDTDLNTGFVLRLTAPATVNCRADLVFGRC
jgi:hypothetical protein